MTSDSDQPSEDMSPRELIGEAVSLLRVEHDVSEAAAFEMLVNASGDSHESVRDTAAGIVHGSPDRADPGTRSPATHD